MTNAATLTRQIANTERAIAQMMQVPGDHVALALATATSHLRYLLKRRAELDAARAARAADLIAARLGALRDDLDDERLDQDCLAVSEALKADAEARLAELIERDRPSLSRAPAGETDAESRVRLGVFYG